VWLAIAFLRLYYVQQRLVCQMNRSDEELKQLAISAQQAPLLSPSRQVALRQLVNGILQSGRLCHPQRGQFTGRYAEIYDEAVQDLMLYICRNIDKYDPDRASVLAWVNVLLERRFFKEAIPKVLGQPSIQRLTLDDLDGLALPPHSPALTEIVRTFIEADPENLFKCEFLTGTPKVNFQTVALRRLAGHSWQEISTEFGVKVGTVSSFYSRCVARFSRQLKAYCVEQS
jgi:DNA-directed RNA polymerase specialized sigma24 family protein